MTDNKKNPPQEDFVMLGCKRLYFAYVLGYFNFKVSITAASFLFQYFFLQVKEYKHCIICRNKSISSSFLLFLTILYFCRFIPVD